MSLGCKKRKVANEVNKCYRKAPSSYVNIIKKETNNITNRMSIGDKIHTLREMEALPLAVKVHKDYSHICPSFRLINPTKTELRVISRVMLRVAEQVNQ